MTGATTARCSRKRRGTRCCGRPDSTSWIWCNRLSRRSRCSCSRAPTSRMRGAGSDGWSWAMMAPRGRRSASALATGFASLMRETRPRRVGASLKAVSIAWFSRRRTRPGRMPRCSICCARSTPRRDGRAPLGCDRERAHAPGRRLGPSRSGAALGSGTHGGARISQELGEDSSTATARRRRRLAPADSSTRSIPVMTMTRWRIARAGASSVVYSARRRPPHRFERTPLVVP